MRTKIQCGWLVGYVGNGHVLWRDAELVYEGTQIVFVGERFEGTADQVIDAGGKLVLVRKLSNRLLIELDMGLQPSFHTIYCGGDRYRTDPREVFGGGAVS